MKNNHRAFTLLEIAVVLSLLGVIAVFTIGISNSVRSMTKMTETKQRMTLIAEKARDYYRGHGTLPGPDVVNAPPTETKVPIGISDFNMEQKYRLDAWGNYFYYFRDKNRQNISYDCGQAGMSIPCLIQVNTNSKTLIQGLAVNGSKVAGVLISAGPNQVIDTNIKSKVAEDDYTWGYSTVYQTTGDDIIIPIDVTQEAIEIVLEDLEVLQNKVKAFDRLFESIDNNNEGTSSDESLVEMGKCPTGVAPCVPNGWNMMCPPLPGLDNTYSDPRQGVQTLDYMMANSYYSVSNNCGSCTSPYWNKVRTFWSPGRPETRDEATRAFIYCFYGIPDKHMIDPWLRGYLWGCGSSVCNNINGYGRQHAQSDPRYHRFFSAGPDGMTDGTGTTPLGAITDDIVF